MSAGQRPSYRKGISSNGTGRGRCVVQADAVKSPLPKTFATNAVASLTLVSRRIDAYPLSHLTLERRISFLATAGDRLKFRFAASGLRWCATL